MRRPKPDSGAGLGQYQTCSLGLHSISLLSYSSLHLLLCQVSSNFAEYFDKLSERIAQLSNYCPRFSEYKKLFPTSARLQQALSDFYAVVVKFCLKALRVVQEKGKEASPNHKSLYSF